MRRGRFIWFAPQRRDKYETLAVFAAAVLYNTLWQGRIWLAEGLK
jgi:hypothetical protein